MTEDLAPGRVRTPDSPEVLARLGAERELVELNARQLGRRLGRCGVTLEDLCSFGNEGLLQAARSYDPAHGVPFRRWANLRIRGAMIDGVRQSGNLPRRVYRELASLQAADGVQDVYDQEEAAQPRASPEAADSRLSTYLAGLATAMAMGTIAGTFDGESEPAEPARTPEEQAEFFELARHVRVIVDRLPDAERALVERHYFHDETLDHAAASLGLSKSWGSRLHARAIDTIARELKKLR